ncbi:MAG: hypothetical protein QOH10_1488 [Actinomycetota bacterium]|nr:hypothetical protein [Actinomycetota bacterium]
MLPKKTGTDVVVGAGMLVVVVAVLVVAADVGERAGEVVAACFGAEEHATKTSTTATPVVRRSRGVSTASYATDSEIAIPAFRPSRGGCSLRRLRRLGTPDARGNVDGSGHDDGSEHEHEYDPACDDDVNRLALDVRRGDRSDHDSSSGDDAGDRSAVARHPAQRSR